MSNENREEPGDRAKTDPDVVIIGPDGTPMSGPGKAAGSSSSGDDGGDADDEENERHITDLVEQPAKVMRIGSMIRQLLDEVKAAPLDEASRTRLAGIHKASIKELEAGLAPELIEELERLSLPFGSETPSEPELRIAQAQLVGWLEGLFHGIQTAIYAQQVTARAQLEQMRKALPPGMIPEEAIQAAHQAAQHGQRGQESAPNEGDDEKSRGGGMYLSAPHRDQPARNSQPAEPARPADQPVSRRGGRCPPRDGSRTR